MNLRRFNILLNLEIAVCNQTNHVVVFVISTGDPGSTGDHAWVSVDLNAIGVEGTRANIALDQEGILLEVSIGSQLKGRWLQRCFQTLWCQGAAAWNQNAS